MTAQQPPGIALASRPIGRALLWPALAVVLGFLLIYNSFGTSLGLKPPARAVASAPAAPGAVAPADDLVLPRSGPSGQLDAPPADDNNLVGWFQEGVTPGERGTSIVAGHVDTKTGPAVFLQLSLLKAGSKVDITREDGTVATFKVDSVETFSKARFPNERVYADAPSPQLRLITCGGDYDKKAKDYTENVVVFAHLDSTKRA
jgi:hypothetical protein